MGLNVGELLIPGLPLLILWVVWWGFSTAFRPRDHGLSDAEGYQRELAARSAAHQAAQVEAAHAARARMDPRNPTRPPSGPHPRRSAAPWPASQYGSPTAPDPGRTALLPDGRLNPQFVQQLRSTVQSGRKVDAVQLFRAATRSDVQSARLYIDRL